MIHRKFFPKSADIICDSLLCMDADSGPLRDDINALEAEVAAGRARAAADQALIAHQQPQVAKLQISFMARARNERHG